ncbi:MAG: DUF1476 domain-containing protein [Robiginitomaculum sp.]|nr:DUF1476 domain-containing protein [Robiginitomaculum sp.]MDQ7077329.1 DUF1476 domain-containing protein [Robiginitomaculum sp.]
MSGFDKREQGYESKFAHDENLEFKAAARRNKLLGLWLAGLMNKSAEEAESYAKQVIIADFEEAGDEDVFRKLRADADAAELDLSDHQIRRKMAELTEEARAQVRSET